MKAMVLKSISNIRENRTPLTLVDMPEPVPGEKEILIKVSACGVCHTELDEIEGRTPPPAFPIILGHQVAGQSGGNREKGDEVLHGRSGRRGLDIFRLRPLQRLSRRE